jgi:LysR family transcriptional activator of nhaA
VTIANAAHVLSDGTLEPVHGVVDRAVRIRVSRGDHHLVPRRKTNGDGAALVLTTARSVDFGEPNEDAAHAGAESTQSALDALLGVAGQRVAPLQVVLPDDHHLLYFWTAVREGSISRAADRLLLAQPTVSGQIRKLEARIGQDLSDRNGRSLVLTDTGQLVYAYAERIFSVGQELVDVLGGGEPGRPAHLRIGIADALPKLVTSALIQPALQGERPVRVICHEDKAERLLAELALRAFDLVLSDAPIGPSARVRAFNHALGECGVAFFAVTGLATKVRRDFPASLAEVPVLLPTDNTMLRRSLDRWFDANGVRPRIVGEFEDSALLKVFGQRGAGVFPAPAIVRNEVSRQYRVRVVETVEEVREQFYAITLERTLKNPLVAELCETARATLAAIE